MRRAILLAVLLATPARAHDQDHPQLNAWFSELKSDSGIPCCDGIDAQRLEDVDWQTVCNDTGCHYQVRLKGKWITVENEKVIKKPNLAGYPFVTLHNGLIQCFMPGGGL